MNSPRPRFTVRVAGSPDRGAVSGFFQDAREWAAGRMAWPRGLLLLWFVTLFWKLIRDPEAWLLIDGLNLGIHEMGHYALSYFGEWLSVLGGSLFEVLAPIGAAIMFYRQRDYFAIAVASCWLGTALFDVGSYVADARARELPLVSPTSADPMHDWYYLLNHAHLLKYDHGIGALFHTAGTVFMVAGLWFGVWLIVQMREKKLELELGSE